jgi:hypothetical protein
MILALLLIGAAAVAVWRGALFVRAERRRRQAITDAEEADAEEADAVSRDAW